jgi:hypothetical protein
MHTGRSNIAKMIAFSWVANGASAQTEGKTPPSAYSDWLADVW